LIALFIAMPVASDSIFSQTLLLPSMSVAFPFAVTSLSFFVPEWYRFDRLLHQDDRRFRRRMFLRSFLLDLSFFQAGAS
jgi:hypothetical protein